MGYVHEARCDLERAFKSFKKALLIQPNSWENNYALADFFRNRILRRKAIKYYDKAIELNPLYPGSYVRRSACFRALGEFEKAEIDLQKVLDNNPDHRGALYHYGLLSIIQKKYDQAEQIISRRERIYPESYSRAPLRAFLLASLGEKDMALEIKMSAFDKFRLHLFLSMRDEVITYLHEDFERVKNTQESWYLYFMNYPQYKFLHSDPIFQNILAKHKELYEENLRKYCDLDL
jgi:tetratricopeptide (TPR) repeat protein